MTIKNKGIPNHLLSGAEISTTTDRVGRTPQKPTEEIKKDDGAPHASTFSNEAKPQAPQTNQDLSNIQTRFKNAVSEVTAVRDGIDPKKGTFEQIMTVAFDIFSKGADGVLNEVSANAQSQSALAGLIGDVGAAMGDKALGTEEDVNLTDAARKLIE